MGSKKMMDMVVKGNRAVSSSCRLLVLSPVFGELPCVVPGQFVEIKVDIPGAMLRRPISVCNVEGDDLWLLVRRAGDATNSICDMEIGSVLNVVLPLGNGFSRQEAGSKVLLVGGGVGIAPMLYYAKTLSEAGANVSCLIASKTKNELMLEQEIGLYCKVCVATDDGSEGYHGFAAGHPVLQEKWDRVACCGPLVMMKTVASKCREVGNKCEVSLENHMACGLGACLCCVEDTVSHGNVCVCTDGPVFDIDDLKWQN